MQQYGGFQLIQCLPICSYMRGESLDRSYLSRKWLKLGFLVPSSWSISNKKTGRVKVFPIYQKIGNKEPYKSGYTGKGNYKWSLINWLRTRVEWRGVEQSSIHQEGWPRKFLLQLLSLYASRWKKYLVYFLKMYQVLFFNATHQVKAIAIAVSEVNPVGELMIVPLLVTLHVTLPNLLHSNLKELTPNTHFYISLYSQFCNK